MACARPAFTVTGMVMPPAGTVPESTVAVNSAFPPSATVGDATAKDTLTSVAVPAVRNTGDMAISMLLLILSTIVTLARPPSVLMG